MAPKSIGARTSPSRGTRTIGKEHRGAQRAEIVEGQDVGDHVLELEAVAQQAHEQRNLETDQDAHDQHEDVQQQPEPIGVGEGEEEQRGGEPADETDHDLDEDEPRREPTRR